MKCPRHQLATGPDGRCVLCRRDDPPAGSIHAPGMGARPLLQLAAGLVLLVSVTTAVVLWTRHQDAVLSSSARVSPYRAAVTPAAARPAEGEPPRATPPPAVVVTEPSEDIDEDAAARDAAVDAPADGRTVEATGPKQPTQEQIRAAVRQIPVSFYITSTCPVCASARAFLLANDISFVEKDIDENPASRAELLSMNPSGSVPTFNVDGRIVVGFDQAQLARLIASNVESRLGVKLDVQLPTGQR